MRILENDFLKVETADFGAELSGIFDKENNRQVLWGADPAYWARHAPVLFPFVGKVNGGFYTHKGIKYPMGQHGFARDMEFEYLGSDGKSLSHRLKSDENTKKVYPFDFELTITHSLEGRCLTVGYEVKNTGAETMYFSIGAHPAFNCPVLPGTEKRDYFAKLGEGKLKYVLIDGESGSVMYKDEKETDGLIRLEESLFDNDALIFDRGQVEKASILYPDMTPYITVSCKGFDSFGLWSKPKAGAPYVCLEPWIGRCDNEGFEGELKDKYGERSLEAGESFFAEFTIETA
ncbi:MAG: aldose 1-epimerase family protein [Clostridiales bacterium]|nr:aldose 1-epimerase family protein [Clostridiales bacterium]